MCIYTYTYNAVFGKSFQYYLTAEVFPGSPSPLLLSSLMPFLRNESTKLSIGPDVQFSCLGCPN